MWAPGFCKALYGVALLLTLNLVLCRGTDEMPILTADFIHRVNNAIEDRAELPFCFTVNLTDITCFWESDTPDVSRFSFYYKPMVPCNLTVVKASDESWWHICQFPGGDVEFFAFHPYFISVMDKQTNATLYRRELVPENSVYTDPPTHFKVSEQKKPLGLLIFLMIPEKSQVLQDCFAFQINYTSQEDQKSLMFSKNEVNAENGYVKLFLDGVKTNADYTISVRMKADDPHDGYWSSWAVTTFQTSNGFDEVHIVLFVVAGFIALIAIVLVVNFQGSFLKSKVWPEIPTPEHHFKELYTTHKGNFKTWLGQTDSYLTWISRNIFHEGPLTTLEVLSELPNAPLSFSPAVPLSAKDTYVVLNENILPHFPAWVDFPVPASIPRGQPSPADVHDEQMSLGSEEPPQDTEERSHECEESNPPMSVEEGPIDAAVMRELPNGVTVMREDSLNSEEGKQSNSSSFEYTVLETCEGLLSPRHRSIPPRQPLKYACLLMPEEESPPPSPVMYQNSPCGHFQSPIYSH